MVCGRSSGQRSEEELESKFFQLGNFFFFFFSFFLLGNSLAFAFRHVFKISEREEHEVLHRGELEMQWNKSFYQNFGRNL